jgi:hypothetical protein
MFLSDWLERRRIRKSFSKLLSPGVIKLIEQDPKKYFGNPEKKHIQFVLVQIDDRDTSARIDALPKIIDAIFDHNGTLGTVLNVSLVFGFFGSPFPGTDTVENRLGAVAGMHTALGERIRIAHGQCVALVGLFGGEKRGTWDALIPNFSLVLEKLHTTPYGSAMEIDPSGNGKPETGNLPVNEIPR